ncbi:MAG: tetratricopeptide repeat protein [Gammaproteobacteria bacterium]|nr:tetratricopeptide repeat protein [Gammaproteobacteria bacterium]
MFRIFIKFVAISITASMLVVMLTSCANLPSLKKSTTASKTSAKTEKSASKSAGKILAQPNFRISKKTASAYNTALKHMRAKNYDTAILEMQKVAKMDERISGPWVNIGVAHKELGDMAKARTAFEKALKINPNNPYALNQLAILNREDGKFEEAEQLYMRALSAYPDYKNAHLNLAILCDVYLRKIDCALGHYQEYLKLTGGEDKQVIAWMSQLKKQGS